MTTTRDLALPQRITCLKHLAAGKPVDVTATITGLTAETVLDLASHHGYPDRDKLAWAVDVLTKKHQDQAHADIPTANAPRVPAAPPRPAVAAVPQPAAPSRPADDLRALVDVATVHPSKRIQSAAAKLLEQAERLRSLLEEDDRKNAARRHAEAEKAKARAEVQRLEEQLAAAKAKLRGSSTSSTTKAAAAGTRKGTPLHKGEHPCRHDGCDKVYDTPQGRSLHERMKCEHRPQADTEAAAS